MSQDMDPETGTVSLEGRRALVTGGSRGIGFAIAKSLLARNVDVVLLGRQSDRLDQARESLVGGSSPCVETVAVDVTQRDSLSDALGGVLDKRGVDILVNNAGGTTGVPFHKLDEEGWDDALALNLSSAFLCTKAILPSMRSTGWGRIVNIASTAGQKGYAYVSAYCAAKHGLIGFTRALALELAKTEITVNAVCPGFADTDMTRTSVENIAAKTGMAAEAARKELAALNPQGRLVQPDEVAEAVVYLCQPSSSSMTGQAISVSGGEVM